MKKISTLLVFAAMTLTGFAQPGSPKGYHLEENIRESAPIINNLVHTKLDVRFDFNKAYMYGKEWLTLKPHFYPTDSVSLDAKGMEIKEVRW